MSTIGENDGGNFTITYSPTFLCCFVCFNQISVFSSPGNAFKWNFSIADYQVQSSEKNVSLVTSNFRFIICPEYAEYELASSSSTSALSPTVMGRSVLTFTQDASGYYG